MKKVDVVLGLQWGDEGKGKVVDVLTPAYQVIARFQGGPNAGHSLHFEGKKYVLHTIPSGIFREGSINIIGNGVVIDPVILSDEIATLEADGVDVQSKLLIAKKAHLILPTHRIIDAASEASNNAATGGAMVPLLSLGIPGGNAAAVMMSALTLKGVQLGPLLLTNQPTYLSATFMSMIVTNILMVIVAMAIAKVFAQILAIPYSYLGPIIMMLALIGTYGDQMSATSVQIMVLAGILGLVVRACHLNSAAIVLGLVLGSMCEQNFSRGYLMARANVFQMFNPTLHPIAFVLIIVCIALLVSPVFMSMKKKKAAS